MQEAGNTDDANQAMFDSPIKHTEQEQNEV